MMVAQGHNSQITDDEQKALLFHHIQKEIEISAKIKGLQNERKAQRKLAQADGITLDALDYAVKSLNAEDKQRVISIEKTRLQVLKWTKLISDCQSDLFTDIAPALERIRGEGERAGLLGKDGNSPYTKGSEEAASWFDGWRSGQNSLAENFKSARAKLAVEDDDDPFPDDDNEEAIEDNVASLQ